MRILKTWRRRLARQRQKRHRQNNFECITYGEISPNETRYKGHSNDSDTNSGSCDMGDSSRPEPDGSGD